MKDSSSRFFAPVILFVYNRLDYTQQTVNALKNNTLSKDTELIVFSDGGKDTKTWHEVNQLRAYLHTVTGFKSVTIVEREVNYYLERNIIEGVTEIINKFGRAIVLEDDVITSPYFLEYMNDALTIYEKEKKVMHISSINHFAINIESDALFTSFMECGWGWATWADRWSLFKYFKSKSDAVRDLSDSDLNRIEYGGRFNCLKSLDADPIPWDICWTIAIYKNKGICLEPKIPLTQNIGLYNGTHYNNLKLFGKDRFDRPYMKYKIKKYPTLIELNPDMEHYFFNEFEGFGTEYNLLGRIVRYFYRLIKRFVAIL